MDKHTWKYLVIGTLLSCLLIANVACQGYSDAQYKALQTELDTTKVELATVQAELSKTKDELSQAKAETESIKNKTSKILEVFSSLKTEIELAQLILDNFAIGFAEYS